MSTENFSPLTHSGAEKSAEANFLCLRKNPKRPNFPSDSEDQANVESGIFFTGLSILRFPLVHNSKEKSLGATGER